MDDTSALEARWAALLPEANAFAKVGATLKKVCRALAQPAGYESLKKVDGALRSLDGLSLPPTLAAEVAAVQVEARAWLEVAWAGRAEGFRESVSAYFEARGVGLQVEGDLLRADPIDVHVRLSEDAASLSYSGEPIGKKVLLVPERIFGAREAALAGLRRRETAPDALAEALIAACRKLGGGRQRLPDLHFQLFIERQSAQAKQSLTKGKLKEYPRAQFAWDLAALLANPHFLVRGAERLEFIEATGSAARSKANSVLVEGTAWAGVKLLPA